MSTSRPAETRNASALLRDGLVWDNHGCMPVGRPNDTSFLPQLRRYRSAGVDAVMLNVGFGDMGVEEHLRTLADMRHWLKARPDEYVLIGTADDVERARATGRLAVGFDIEGANAIADQPSLIETYYDLGVRWMLLAYNRNNRVGGGCQDEDTGLTAYGREVIAEMERVGMQVCCSHTGYRTVRDVFEVVTKPVIFSHSNARAVHAHPRNVPDDLIRACAATGGVVGLNGLSVFLGPGEDLVETFVRHVEHVVSLVGPGHVALGLDYVFDRQELDEILVKMRATFPPGLGYDEPLRFVEPEQLERVVEVLLSRGFRTADLEALLGGNLMRLARSVWKAPRPAAEATGDQRTSSLP
ncbi:MAG: membrane dipeptidase [Holophagales bacterium]|nr:membrane dipeptidase [Holophagales bacterium]